MYGGRPDEFATLAKDSPTTNRDFITLYKLIHDDYPVPHVNVEPRLISRFKVENPPYVDVPKIDSQGKYIAEPGSGGQIILGNDWSPAVIAFCTVSAVDFKDCELYPIGNRFTLLEQVDDLKRSIRLKFNVVVTLLGITLSLLERRRKEVIKENIT